MTPDAVFSLVNPLALVAWLILMAFPRRRWATHIAAVIVPALLAVAYVALVAANWGRTPGGFGSLDGVAQLFGNRWLLLAGWIHYLAFDLLVGRWEVLDARDHRLSHAVVIPCLLLTFMFGPAGWLLYVGVRSAFGRAAGASSFNVSPGARALSL
jgi:hypothetical protein